MMGTHTLAWQNAAFTASFLFLFLFFALVTGAWYPLALTLVCSWVLSYLSLRYGTSAHAVVAGDAVLITGASQGFGAAIALRLASIGCTVFAGVRRVEDGDKLLAQAQLQGTLVKNNIVPVILDVTSAEQIAAAYRFIKSTLSSSPTHQGRLIALINNAGIPCHSPTELVPLEELRRVLEVNVIALVAVTQAFCPLLREAASAGRTARLIMMGSGAGSVTLPSSGPYSCTKHAVESLCDALRVELNPFHIDVPLIRPGFISTGFQDLKWQRATEMVNSHQPSTKGSSEPYCGQKALESYQKRFQMKKSKRTESGQPVSWVSDAVEDALLATSPLPRYVVGREVAASFITRVMPSWLFDRFALRWDAPAA